MSRSFAPCSDLKTKQILWSCYKNAEQIKINGEPSILQSYEISGFFRDKYSSDVR